MDLRPALSPKPDKMTSFAGLCDAVRQAQDQGIHRRGSRGPRNAKRPTGRVGRFTSRVPDDDLLSHGNSVLSSACHRFTVLFGMGRSGSSGLWSSGIDGLFSRHCDGTVSPCSRQPTAERCRGKARFGYYLGVELDPHARPFKESSLTRQGPQL